ncbi:MAG: DUF4304 domain-containing protein [Candidatus Obscuribacter sp.]|nr:DUF4304 domain-containing protein [Candidatus Obscuribacter sp.]
MTELNEAFKKSVKNGLTSLLKPAGFKVKSAGYFRRKVVNATQVVHVCYYLSPRDAVRYKNSGLAFSVELGVHFDFIPSPFDLPVADIPRITDCQFRTFLRKTIVQPQFENGVVWSSVSALADVDEILNDAKSVLASSGFDWFAATTRPEVALLIATSEKESLMGNGTWGMGNLGSPLRYLYIAFLSRYLGEVDRASEAFEQLRKVCSKADLNWNFQRLAQALEQTKPAS